MTTSTHLPQRFFVMRSGGDWCVWDRMHRSAAGTTSRIVCRASSQDDAESIAVAINERYELKLLWRVDDGGLIRGPANILLYVQHSMGASDEEMRQRRERVLALLNAGEK